MRLLMLGLVAACGGRADVYASCEEAADCDAIVPEGAEAQCLPKNDWAFCTWSCDQDADCNGDQDDDYDFLCASFEEEADTYCFPSCSDGDSGVEECPENYECRSTGGGAENRRVCFPNDL